MLDIESITVINFSCASHAKEPQDNCVFRCNVCYPNNQSETMHIKRQRSHELEITALKTRVKELETARPVQQQADPGACLSRVDITVCLRLSSCVIRFA